MTSKTASNIIQRSKLVAIASSPRIKTTSISPGSQWSHRKNSSSNISTFANKPKKLFPRHDEQDDRHGNADDPIDSLDLIAVFLLGRLNLSFQLLFHLVYFRDYFLHIIIDFNIDQSQHPL